MWKKKKQYDLFVSIGAVCACSNALRNAGLQYRSFPFDWISGGTFLERINLLTTNFKNWLEINSMELIGTREHPIPAKIYTNKITNINFSHDFALDLDLNKSFPIVLEKYNRRINRLFKMINTSRKVLFVYLEPAGSNQIIENQILIDGISRLEKKFQNIQIDLLYIYNEKNTTLKNKKTDIISKNIMKVSFDFFDYSSKEPLGANMPILENFFKNYKISYVNLTTKDKFKKITKSLQWIFSAKNEHKHKCITILGIKFKFLRH